jgi:hypothetical protein
MKTSDIARATHEMNRLFCQLIGDFSQPPWKEAPDWQRESAAAGVQAVLDGTTQTAEDQHVQWVRQKLDDGWTYGPEKDAEKKTHPCLVPYHKLPPEQQAKDAIFRAVVHGLRFV